MCLYRLMTTTISSSGHGKAHWFEEAPPERFQKYFNSWNFTSPHTIRVEAGLSTMMEQYDRNVKIRQLIGTDGVHKQRKHGAGAGGSAGVDNLSNQLSSLSSGGVLQRSHSKDSSGCNSETDEMMMGGGGYLEPRPIRKAERVSRPNNTNSASAAAVDIKKGGSSSSSPSHVNKKGGTTMLNPFLR